MNYARIENMPHHACRTKRMSTASRRRIHIVATPHSFTTGAQCSGRAIRRDAIMGRNPPRRHKHNILCCGCPDIERTGAKTTGENAGVENTTDFYTAACC